MTRGEWEIQNQRPEAIRRMPRATRSETPQSRPAPSQPWWKRAGDAVTAYPKALYSGYRALNRGLRSEIEGVATGLFPKKGTPSIFDTGMAMSELTEAAKTRNPDLFAEASRRMENRPQRGVLARVIEDQVAQGPGIVRDAPSRMAVGAGEGALVGSVVPGIGTATGAGVGGVAGLIETRAKVLRENEMANGTRERLAQMGFDVTDAASVKSALESGAWQEAEAAASKPAGTAAVTQGLFDIGFGGWLGPKAGREAILQDVKEQAGGQIAGPFMRGLPHFGKAAVPEIAATSVNEQPAQAVADRRRRRGR